MFSMSMVDSVAALLVMVRKQCVGGRHGGVAEANVQRDLDEAEHNPREVRDEDEDVRRREDDCIRRPERRADVAPSPKRG